MTIKSINGVNNNVRNLQNIPQKDVQPHKYHTRDEFNMPKGMTIDSSINYLPNLSQLSSEELFDIQFNSGTKLSNGAVLIRPVILSMGTIDIEAMEDNNKLYKLTRQPIEYNAEKETRIIGEEELLKNRSLTRGAIKEISSGKYRMVFLDKDGTKQNVEASKKECLQLLRDNLLYM